MAVMLVKHISLLLNRSSLLLTVALLFCFSCEQQPKLFKKLEASYTGIDFRSELVEDDQHNILNFTNLYTGSGVGIGDFNGDGLADIFFGGNQESSRMYLNKGQLQFQDATEAFGLTTDRWITGVSVVDINADGWDDIYLSVSGKASKEQQKNLLFINEDGKGFSEQAEQYGLADSAQCTHANFFDYDKDGDLDVFLAINPTDYTLYNVNNIRPKKQNGEAASTDKLYRNNRISSDSVAHSLPFTDVSAEAGILLEGYSLGLNISDINKDNWPDIYVTNDFLSNDILYINNQDGTFSNQAADYLKHTSFASMGIDVADINNDGNPEIYVLDMYPEDNYRQKMILGSDNYDRFQYMLQADYEPQYSRNTLQLNNGDGSFSEIGQLANIHKTDWSWSPLIADYDNDGYRDIFVTNGFRRDLGDLDYINYNNTAPFGNPETLRKNQLERIIQQPGAQLPNYAFRNINGLQFEDASAAWGLDEPSYAHGASYADLDKDGDLDLIVSTVSQEVLIYENQTNQHHQYHYLSLEFEQKSLVGTKVWIYYSEQMQYAEYTPYRGYLSTLEEGLHFGLELVW
ncbi:MAG: CRTAC1 family protein [Bacteroidota bacterium]